MNLRGLTMVVLGLVAILGLGFAGYSNVNPHVLTVTQQQFITNTQSVLNTQTQTVISTTTMTNTQTVNNAALTAAGYTVNYQNCGYNGCYYYYAPTYASVSDLCNSTGQNNTIQCSGYIYRPSEACTQLAIPYYNPDWLETTAYLYVTLYNLPTNHPASGWVTVTGQLNQGYNAPPYGPFMGGCLGDYINVTTIS